MNFAFWLLIICIITGSIYLADILYGTGIRIVNISLGSPRLGNSLFSDYMENITGINKKINKISPGDSFSWCI